VPNDQFRIAGNDVGMMGEGREGCDGEHVGGALEGVEDGRLSGGWE
jgi:hypothetical protein